MGTDVLGVGLSLPPDSLSLSLLWPLIVEAVDYYEVAPETLWRPGPSGGNGYRARFLQLKADSGRPFVAHGVGLSMAHTSPSRRQQWLQRLAADQADFDFQWYTDHLGWTHSGTQNMSLPLAAPDTQETRQRLVQTLRDIRSFAPAAGLENSVSYFLPYPPLQEPEIIGAVLEEAGGWLLLDLHNLYTMSVNMGFSAEDWLARAPLERVIEIHVSGGLESRPGWLPGGRRLRLDSHDAAVPEAVWSLLDGTRPRGPGLRGITLEYIEGSFTAHDLPRIGDELARARAVL
ncbi:MAG: hypothetical protein ACI8S6_005216 [Myxococcota bacterium]